MKSIYFILGLLVSLSQLSHAHAAEKNLVNEEGPVRTPAATLREHVTDAFDDYEDGKPLPDCLEILTKCDFSDDKVDEVYLDRMEAAVLAMNLDAPQFVLHLLELNILSPLVPFTTRVLSLTLAHCSGYADNAWMVKNLTHLNEFFMGNADKVTTTPLSDILSLVAFSCEKGEKADGERIWRAHWQRLALEVRYPEWATFASLCEGLHVVIPQTDITKLKADDADLELSQSLVFTTPWFKHITSHSHREITKARVLRLPVDGRTKLEQARAEIETSLAPRYLPLGNFGSIDSDLN